MPLVKSISLSAVSFGKADVVSVPAWGVRLDRYEPAPRNLSYKHVGMPTVSAAERAARAKARRLAKEVGARTRRDDEEEPTAAPALSRWCGPTRWLMDTGSAFDLIGEKDVPAWYRSRAEDADSDVELSTANGRTVVDKKIPMQVGALLEVVEPLLLPSTPPVLSLGKRCMEDGCSFHWPARQNPYMVDARGVRHELEVKDNVPYLLDGPEQFAEREATAAPALESPRDAGAAGPTLLEAAPCCDSGAAEICEGPGESRLCLPPRRTATRTTRVTAMATRWSTPVGP